MWIGRVVVMIVIMVVIMMMVVMVMVLRFKPANAGAERVTMVAIRYV